MIALLLLVIQSNLVPDRNRVIDFCEPASRLVNLTGPLSAALGIEVDFSPLVRDEVLAAYAKGVTRQSLASAIAETMDATWVKAGNRLRLDITSENQTERLRAERDNLEPIVKKWQTERQAMLAEVPELDATAATLLVAQEKALNEAQGSVFVAQQALQSKLPEGRFLARIATRIPSEDLAKIGLNERKVFVTKPNRIQGRLNLDKGDVDRYRRELAAYSKALSEGGVEGRLQSIPSDLTWDKVFFQTIRSVSEFTISAFTLDENGRQTNLGFCPIPIWLPVAEPSQTESKPISYGKFATEFRDIWRSIRTDAPVSPSPEFRSYASKPDLNEPLAVGVSEAIKALGEVREKPVIARCWDDLWLTSLAVSRQVGSGTEGFWSQLLRQRALIHESNGWISIKPSMPHSLPEQQMNRQAVRKLVENTIAAGTISLDEVADFAFASPGPTYSDPWALLWLAGAPPTDRSFNIVTGLWMRIYGSLSSSERATLKLGQAIPWTRLSVPTRSLLAKQLFAPDSTLWIGNGTNGSSSKAEPTQVLANGVPNGAFLTAKTSQRPVLLGVVDKPRPFGAGLVQRGVASIAYQVVHPTATTHRDAVGQTRFKIGSSRTLQLRLQVTDGLFIQQGIQGMDSIGNQSYGPVELPEPWKSKIGEAIEFYRSNPNAPAPYPTQDEFGN